MVVENIKLLRQSRMFFIPRLSSARKMNDSWQRVTVIEEIFFLFVSKPVKQEIPAVINKRNIARSLQC